MQLKRKTRDRVTKEMGCDGPQFEMEQWMTSVPRRQIEAVGRWVCLSMLWKRCHGEVVIKLQLSFSATGRAAQREDEDPQAISGTGEGDWDLAGAFQLGDE